MRLRAALTLLAVAVPSGARAAHGRLSLSVLAGGGYASDIFIGAGLGPDTLLQVVPNARLDLSLSPRWKLACLGDLSYGHNLSSGFTSIEESAALEGRYIGDATWDAALTVSVENASYSLGSPLDLTGPLITSTVAVRASPLVRLRGLGFEWRAAGVVGYRSSTSADEAIPEHDLAILGGLMHPLGEHASFAATYKLAHNGSASADFTLTSHALFALLSWRVGEIDLKAQLQLQTATFATSTHEQLGWLTVSAAHPLSESLDVEASYSFAANHSDDPSRPSATRHLAFIALRWRFAEVQW